MSGLRLLDRSVLGRSVLGRSVLGRQERSGGRAPYAARHVAAVWAGLGAATVDPPPFEPAMVDGLPEPARRWLTHAIAPGTPLWQSAEVSMTGRLRLGRWRPFTARQAVAPGRGYVWAATARVAGLPVVGYDRYSDGTGEMRWRLLDVVPVVTASGPDTTRSALGRLVSEIVLVPTAFQALTWTPGSGPDTVRGTLRDGAESESVELRVDPDGAAVCVLVDRWASPDGGPFARVPFGVALTGEHTAGGVRVPASCSAGWWWGTARQGEGEFFRARVTGVRFR